MEIIVGLLRFIGEITGAVAVAAWSHYQEKFGRN